MLKYKTKLENSDLGLVVKSSKLKLLVYYEKQYAHTFSCMFEL
jgi:hypothetical protein